MQPPPPQTSSLVRLSPAVKQEDYPGGQINIDTLSLPLWSPTESLKHCTSEWPDEYDLPMTVHSRQDVAQLIQPSSLHNRVLVETARNTRTTSSVLSMWTNTIRWTNTIYAYPLLVSLISLSSEGNCDIVCVPHLTVMQLQSATAYCVRYLV